MRMPGSVQAPPASGDMLAIAAHPDDIESWCAGTLALAVDAGARVSLLLVTSGDKGSGDPTADPYKIAMRREHEAQAAARALGLSAVYFLRYPDGEVEPTQAFRGVIVEWLRRLRPGLVFTHDPEHPEPPYLTHRDHRIVGRAVLDAIYPLARDHLYFPAHGTSGLQPHAVRQVWLFASSQPNTLVDIAPALDRKIAARLKHESQTHDPAALDAGWRQRAARIGEPGGLAAGEAFVCLDLDG